MTSTKVPVPLASDWTLVGGSRKGSHRLPVKPLPVWNVGKEEEWGQFQGGDKPHTSNPFYMSEVKLTNG